MKYFYLALLTLLVSCKPSQPKETTKSVAQTTYSEPHIMFLFMQASQENNKVEIKIIDKKIVKGKLKGSFVQNIVQEELQAGKWLVSFKDQAKNNSLQMQIFNPLIEEIEYINDDGNFEKKTLNHVKKDFVIRIPYDSSIKMITFESLFRDNQRVKQLFINQVDIP
jgi:hypothetical protein